MTKDFVFTYADSYDEDTQGCYPSSTSVKIEHEFQDDTTWDVILYQMCKFLEATGYVGITEKIIIKDKFGLMRRNGLFEYTHLENDFDFDAYDDEDEEDDDEDSELEIVCSEDADSTQKQVAKGLQEYVDSISEAERKDMIKFIKTGE